MPWADAPASAARSAPAHIPINIDSLMSHRPIILYVVIASLVSVVRYTHLHMLTPLWSRGPLPLCGTYT